MEALFLKLVNMSITASWLVLAILAVRLIFKKAPKWILCLLWGLVAFRLICPFSIESSLSLIPNPEPLSQETSYSSETVKQAHGDILDSEGNVILERHPAANGDILDSEGNVIVEIQDGIRVYPEEAQTHNWLNFLSRIWLVGFAVMLAYTAVSYYLLRQKVATAIPLVKGIKQSEYVDSPFVLGIIRPVIYLPFGMDEADCAYVIAHEKAHIRRRDHWWKPLGFLLLSVYWFNPVLWVAYILLCRDIEAACDEKVIQDMEKEERRAYSTALLNCSVHRRRIAACPLAFGETGVKARVKSVMNYKKPAFWVILTALIISIIVAVCFLTNPKDVPPITMTADYVNREQAYLKFHFEEQLPENSYQIGEAYSLEALADGSWQPLPKPIQMQPFEQVVLVTDSHADFDAWSLINWKAVYGKLPDGIYRITKEITLHSDSEEPETYPLSVEFSIGGTADEYVTYRLEDITPAGAKLYEHEKVKDSTQLVYNGDDGIWLESHQDGQWNYMEATQYIEPILRKEKYSVHQTHFSDYIQLDWSTIYGELPDGTYRIAREVTNTSEDDLRVCTAYAEFTISASPVTISLENVHPTGATILFHQNKDLIDGKLLCDYSYFIQKNENGDWIDLFSFTGPENQICDIALLHHNGVDWKQQYGILPVGSYRLGKVIPVRSGENPEYKTVYAEFSIDNVYTWFDDYSGNTDERSPKFNVIDLFGMDGASLSYQTAENAIHLVTAESSTPIISTDVWIRSIFLTDLTGDGISEVCATVQTTADMRVQVYDAAQKKLYELQNPENAYYTLTKKEDRLCVVLKDAVSNVLDYGQLSLNSAKGLEIRELDPEVLALTKQVICVDVDNRKHACVSLPDQLSNVLNQLRNLEQNVQPASPEQMAKAQVNTFDHVYFTVNYELGKKIVGFTKDFDLVWEYGSSEGYRVPNPEEFRAFADFVTDGVRNKETSGEPFATVDAPWDWCAGVNENAISTAEIYICLDVSSYGSGSSVSSTNGNLPADVLRKFTGILNQLPEDAFSGGSLTQSDYRWFLQEQIEGTCAISVVDNVNKMAVAVRLYKGYVEMILTEDLDNVLERTYGYLKTPAAIWRIENPELRTFLESIRKNPPVINYSVGAEYEWQDPVEFTKDDFTLKLRLIEDWIIEQVSDDSNSGIRCRPEGIEDGWIYFSFWPNGYSVEEENRYYSEGQSRGFPSKTSFPASVESPLGLDTRNAIWSYQAYNTDIGDYVIINDGADDWFMEYKDQISDIITYMNFTVETQ